MRNALVSMTCLLAILAASLKASTAKPVSDPRLDVMTNVGGGPSAAIGNDGHTLVAWAAREENGEGIYATETGPGIAPLSDSALRIAGSGSYSPDPIVTFTGSSFLVVWNNEDGVHSATLRDGAIVKPDHLVVPGSLLAAAAGGPGRSVVVYQNTTVGSARPMFATIVDETGHVERTLPVQAPLNFVEAAAVAVPDGFLLLDREDGPTTTGRLLVRHCSDAGLSAPIDLGGAIFSSSFSLAASESAVLAAWIRKSDNWLVVRPLGLSGRPTRVAFPIAKGVSSPSVAWTGSSWLVTYSGAGDLHAAVVTADGSRIDRMFDLATTYPNESGSVVVSDGQMTSIFWKQSPRTVSYVYTGAVIGTTVNAEGDVAPPKAVSWFPVQQDDPAIATVGNVSLVARVENIGGASRSIVIGRIDADGNSLDGYGIVVSPGILQHSPAVASNGSEFLVTWVDETSAIPGQARIFAQRVAPDLTLLGERSEITDRSQAIPDIQTVWSGSSYLVVWSTSGGIALARVSSAGDVIARRTIAYEPSQRPVLDVRLAAGPGGFLVTTHNARPCYFECVPQPLDVYALRLDRTGAPLGGAFRLAANAAAASVGTDGQRYLVAWTDQRGLVGEYLDSTATTVSPQFVIHPRIDSSYSNLYDARPPFIVADGDGFLVAASLGESSARLPILAIVRSESVASIGSLDAGSVRTDPDVRLFSTSAGIRALDHEVDAELDAVRVFTRSVPNEAATDVGLEIDSPPNGAFAGAPINVTLRIENSGTMSATNAGVIVRADLFQFVELPPGCERGSYYGSALCRVSLVEPGQVARLTFVATPSGSPCLNDCEVEWRVAAYAEQNDPFPANNTATATIVWHPYPPRRRGVRR